MCDNALNGEQNKLTEAEIGVAVFGKRVGYNPSEDNTVRVAARHLRTKLQEHFATVGANEPFMIDVPKGGYVPVFVARPAAPSEDVEYPEELEFEPPPATRPGFFGGWLVALFLLGLLALTLWAWRSGRPFPAALTPQEPTLFSEFLKGSKQPVRLVIADASAYWWQTYSGRPLRVEEYASQSLPEPENPQRDPALGQYLRGLAEHRATGLASIQLALRFAGLAGRSGFSLPVRHSRDLTMRELSEGDFILLSDSRGNPWVALFEKDLDFSFRYSEDGDSVRVADRAVAEPKQAVKSWPASGEILPARIALVRDRRAANWVLLISGPSPGATESAGLAATQPWLWRELRKHIGSNGLDKISVVELLLTTHAVDQTPTSTKLLAARLKFLE